MILSIFFKRFIKCLINGPRNKDYTILSKNLTKIFFFIENENLNLVYKNCAFWKKEIMFRFKIN